MRHYRRDIDGLRGIAVLAVILFHFGLLANGFLGVDVFFVISGYLITGIIYGELTAGHFSVTKFYLRRIRRILPLAFFISLVALAIGLVTMLPDDLENLAESVVATNLFANNVLQLITTRNYWDLVNEYKPLFHTWSLGIEEQYYLLYPLLFIVVGKSRRRLLLPLLALLAIASLGAFFWSRDAAQRFYLIQFRFFELALGGVAAILLNGRLLNHKALVVPVLLLVVLLSFAIPFLSPKIVLVLTVLATLGIIVTANEKSAVTAFLLQNKLIVGIGVISYSLYMWHQVLLSYTRYAVVQVPRAPHLAAVFALTVVLSVLSYRFVEQPFRNRHTVRTGPLLVTLGAVFVIVTSSAFVVYRRAGILRDVPELEITTARIERNMHATYNTSVREYDRPFSPTQLVKVLVVGNSFGRDWANVLFQSKYRDTFELSYLENEENHAEMIRRVAAADVVFYSTPVRETLRRIGLAESKIWAVGTKSFGISSGFFYNYRGNGYCAQRTPLEQGFYELNVKYRNEWGPRYLDIIGKMMDDKRTVPVFTPDCKFISQDAHHLTRAGAQYIGQLFDMELASLLRVQARTPAGARQAPGAGSMRAQPQ